MTSEEWRAARGEDCDSAGHPRRIANSFPAGSHRRSYADVARVFVTDTTCGRHWRALIVVDFALGQCGDVDLCSLSSVCAETVIRGRVSKQYTCHSTVSPSSQPDADDDHIKRDGDDWRDLVISDDVQWDHSREGARHDGLTMSSITNWPLDRFRKQINDTRSVRV